MLKTETPALKLFKTLSLVSLRAANHTRSSRAGQRQAALPATNARTGNTAAAVSRRKLTHLRDSRVHSFGAEQGRLRASAGLRKARDRRISLPVLHGVEVRGARRKRLPGASNAAEPCASTPFWDHPAVGRWDGDEVGQLTTGCST